MKTIYKKMIETTLLASGLILLTACGGGGSSKVPDTNTTVPDTNTTVPEPTSITHNGTTYGFVTSPHTGKIWLDRNLGASRVCEQFDDSACYGDYYQWGRAFDGHQDSTSGTSTMQTNNVFDSGTNGFIVSHLDWASVDTSGATRSDIWSRTDGTSVCPSGFRVPTSPEALAETVDAGITNTTAAFDSFLKLPSTGNRRYTDGALIADGVRGYMWTSSLSGNSSLRIRFTNTAITSGVLGRGYGEPVRCIKN